MNNNYYILALSLQLLVWVNRVSGLRRWGIWRISAVATSTLDPLLTGFFLFKVKAVGT